MRPLKSKKDRVPIKEEEFYTIVLLTKKDKSLKSTTKKKLLRAFHLLYVTGARVSEIVNITLEDMQFIYKNNYLILKDTKVGAIQRLVFVPKICEGLKALDYSDCKTYLFYKNKSDKAMNKQGLTKLINKYLAKYLSVLYTSHSFRSGFITRIVELTGNIKIAQSLARHKNTQMTIRYIGVSNKDITNTLNTLF